MNKMEDEVVSLLKDIRGRLDTISQKQLLSSDPNEKWLKCPDCGSVVFEHQKIETVWFDRSKTKWSVGFQTPKEKFRCVSCGKLYDDVNAIANSLKPSKPE